MRWAPLCRSVALTATAVALAAPAAFGQTPGVGPNRPLFGARGTDSTGRRTLDVAIDFAEAYDQNLLVDVAGLTPSPFQSSGFYTMLAPSLDFQSRGGRLQVGITAGSNARYYPDLRKVVATNHYAGVGVTAEVTPRTSIGFNQGVTYAPAYLYGLFARTAPPALGDVVPPASDYALDSQHSYASSTMARLTHKVSPRGAFSFTSDHRYTQFAESLPGYLNLRSYDAGGEYTHSLNRNVKLRLGYTYRNTQYTRVQRPVEHDVDAGLEYSRPLSRARRTQARFAVGPTLVTGPLAAGELQSASSRFRLVGDAFVDHQMGRTWHARGAYHRGLAYIEGLPAPVYTDAASVQSAGFVNRRLDLSFSASYTTGNLATQATVAPVQTYSGEARVRFALTRECAAYADYLFYDYTFDPSLPLPPGLPHHLRRNGVRAGLTLWLPVRSR